MRVFFAVEDEYIWERVELVFIGMSLSYLSYLRTSVYEPVLDINVYIKPPGYL